MCKLFRLFVPLLILLALGALCIAQTPVLTRSYDNARTGANTSEAILTPADVSHGLRKLFSLDIPDDPRIEAQPLYVPALTMSDGKKHDVVYVFSMANTVWAFDARTGARIWQNPVRLGKPFRPKVLSKPGEQRKTEIDLFGINILWGILSTPVIDLDTQTMYLVNWVLDAKGEAALTLHALRLSDGKKLPLGVGGKLSLPIQAALKDATGAPVIDATGKKVELHQNQRQRAALLLVPLHGEHKTLFVATTGGENPGDPRGWVVAFDVDSFERTAAWVSTPSSFGGGIWQASQGPAADEEGNVYVMTGNGGYIEDQNGNITDFIGKTDFAETFAKLRYAVGPQGAATLTLVDWFTPFKDSEREKSPVNYRDQDLGSGAPVVPPGMSLVLGAGKDGILYVLDRNNMGKAVGDFSKLKAPPIFFTYFPGFGVPPTGNLDFPAPFKTHHLHGSPVFWNGPERGPMLFDWGENESLRAWTLDASGRATFVAKSAEISSKDEAVSAKGEGGMPGGMLTLSANRTQSNTGIVWATVPISGNANTDVVEGVVRAYDATTLDANKNSDGTPRLKLLWDSQQISNNRFAFSKFCNPFVADGKLFVTTYGSWPDAPGNHGRVDVYTLK